MQKKQKSQIHIERIGKAQGIPNVKYVIYPKKGKIMDACGDKPFKLETDNHVSSLLAFFGQVREKATVFVQ